MVLTLRNPVTVLKGTVKQLRRGGENAVEREQALKRLETYTLRIEKYVEAMSSIQRLEQMPVCRKVVDSALLRQELEETAKLLAAPCRPSIRVSVEEQCVDRVYIDHGIFLTVAENLIGNAVRGACLSASGRWLSNTFRRGRRPGISGSASKRRPETVREGFGGWGAFRHGTVQQSGALREAWRRTAAGKRSKRGRRRCADHGSVGSGRVVLHVLNYRAVYVKVLLIFKQTIVKVSAAPAQYNGTVQGRDHLCPEKALDIAIV